jgi:hypothetical protein
MAWGNIHPRHKFKRTAQSESINRRPKAPLVTNQVGTAGALDAHLRRRRCSTVSVPDITPFAGAPFDVVHYFQFCGPLMR